MDSTLEPTEYSVATDVSSLLAAASFIEPFSGLCDPKAADVFIGITDAFCNNAQLVLPLPKKKIGNIPLFGELWKTDGLNLAKSKDAKISEKGFQEIGTEIADSFVKYIEGHGYTTGEFDDMAKWVAFQFSPEVVKGHATRVGLEAMRQCGQLAHELIAKDKIPQFINAIGNLQGDTLRKPNEYVELLEGSNKLGSWTEIYVTYSLSVCVRGYSYAKRLYNFSDNPLYQYHWMRIPAYDIWKTEIIFNAIAAPVYPWGKLLRKIYDPINPIAIRDPSRVSNVICHIRRQFLKEDCEFMQLKDEQDSENRKLTEKELKVLDILQKATLNLRSILTIKKELITFLRDIDRPFDNPIELISHELEQEWFEDEQLQKDKVVRICRRKINE